MPRARRRCLVAHNPPKTSLWAPLVSCFPGTRTRARFHPPKTDVLSSTEPTSLAHERTLFTENPAVARERSNLGYPVTDRCLAMVRKPDSARISPAPEALGDAGAIGGSFGKWMTPRLRIQLNLDPSQSLCSTNCRSGLNQTPVVFRSAPEKCLKCSDALNLVAIVSKRCSSFTTHTANAITPGIGSGDRGTVGVFGRNRSVRWGLLRSANIHFSPNSQSTPATRLPAPDLTRSRIAALSPPWNASGRY